MQKILIAAIVSLFCASGAMAQSAPTPPAAAKAGKADTKARSADSIECSKQADAKGLHGPERKTFRAKCKKELLQKKS
jgi:hypothetical protein